MDPILHSMMLWQYNHCREQSVAEWVETLRLGGIDCFRPKSHQAQTLMGKIYRHPLAPVSLDEIERQYDEFAMNGITYFPWCVPEGRNVAAEAELAIAVARRCGNRIEIDLEPYGRETSRTDDDFWVGDFDGIPDYFQRLKDAGLWVICNVDPRGVLGRYNNADPLRLDRIAHLVDRFLSQSYDVGFGMDYGPLFETAVGYLRGIGAAEVGIVLDARAGQGITERAEYAQQLGAVEVSCWAADMAVPATYEGFAAVPAAHWFPEPELDVEIPAVPEVYVERPPDELVAAIVAGLEVPFDRAGDLVNAGYPVGAQVHEHIKAIKELLGVA